MCNGVSRFGFSRKIQMNINISRNFSISKASSYKKKHSKKKCIAFVKQTKKEIMLAKEEKNYRQIMNENSLILFNRSC